MTKCNLCNTGALVNMSTYKIIEATTKYSQHHVIIVPHFHIPQDLSIRDEIYYFKELLKFGNTTFPTGYWIRFNKGKYCSIPEHFHMHLISHDGEHTPGHNNRCLNCDKYEKIRA
jgi:hypothetical protein